MSPRLIFLKLQVLLLLFFLLIIILSSQELNIDMLDFISKDKSSVFPFDPRRFRSVLYFSQPDIWEDEIRISFGSVYLLQSLVCQPE
jgi:hypothetical protein